MNTHVLAEYLVKLGWDVDQQGLVKLQGTVKQVQRELEDHTTGVTGLFLKMGLAVAGVFTAISAAALALADNVSQNELGFQLFALRMYMSTEAAKKLKIATDALGYSLDEIAWNPELRQRYLKLIDDQTKLEAEMGGDYQENMRRLRDIRFEFTRTQVSLRYLGMAVVNNLARALGKQGILLDLEHFNDWFIHNLPNIADRWTRVLVPVLKDTGHMIEDIGKLFLRFIGVIANDDKLKKGDLSLENFALAFDHIVNGADKAIKILDGFLGKLDALVQWFDAHPRIASIVLGGAAGAAVGSAMGPIGAVAGAAIGAAAGDAANEAAKSPESNDDRAGRYRKEAHDAWEHIKGMFGLGGLQSQSSPGTTIKGDSLIARYGSFMSSSRDAIAKQVALVAQAAGIPAEIALAVAKAENNFRQDRNSPAGAIGVMQLMPGTAKGLGVDANKVGENIVGGVEFLAHLFAKFGNWEDAIAAYNYKGDNFNPKAPLPKETQDYLARVGDVAGAIQIDAIHIHIDKPSATQEEIRDAVATGVADGIEKSRGKQSKERQRNMAQLAGSVQ